MVHYFTEKQMKVLNEVLYWARRIGDAQNAFDEDNIILELQENLKKFDDITREVAYGRG